MARTTKYVKRIGVDDYVKANRIGSRNSEMENQSGWQSKHKIHKSKKAYNRKEKHKNSMFL